MAPSFLEDLRAMRRSEVARQWLRSSWRIWAGAGVFAIVAAVAFPPIARDVVEWLLPPQESDVHLFGHVVHTGITHANSHVEPVLSFLIAAIWTVGVAFFLVLLARKIRPAIAAAPATASHDVAATILPDGDASRRIGAQGRYKLEGEIGRGGMGVVWRGHDSVLDRPVALKELPATADADLRERFRQEARALAKLSHPNVVAVYDLVEEGGRMFLAMELVDGGDLHTLLRDAPGGKLAPTKAAALGAQIAGGLAAAHAKGIVHRDVKPLNVLVARGGVAKVTDFGLAKLAEQTMHTFAGAVLGSPRYMSPEQAAGKPADARSDVYGFGATLFHCVAGRPPFEGEMQVVLAAHISQPPPSARALDAAVPAELDALLGRLLAKEPSARPFPLDSVERELRALANASG